MSVPATEIQQRKRELPQSELEATSELRLGEFQDVPTLSLSEARLVINKVLDLRRKGEKKIEEPEYALSVYLRIVLHDRDCKLSRGNGSYGAVFTDYLA